MYRIKGISASGNGERLLLKIVLPSGESETLAINCETYRRFRLSKGEISKDTYAELVDEADYESALIKGMRILGYGANSPCVLKDKLCRAGISRYIAERAVNELCRRGYISEESDAWRVAEGLIKKGYGSKKIIFSLRVKGYSDDAIESVSRNLNDVDFDANCLRVAKSKFKNLQNERIEVQKAIAKLVNLGYNVVEAKRALEALLSE